MSDPIQHECGIAMVRLKKTPAYYLEKYGNAFYGFQKLMLLMEKQHNRGQDGAGIGCCKLSVPLGQPYLFRERSAEKDSLPRLFGEQLKKFDVLCDHGMVDPKDAASVKRHFDYGGEILLGHLRYGTSGVFGPSSCHPYVRRSNWQTRTLMVMGNFNMTNTGELNSALIRRGQHPVFDTDTQTVLEEIGYHLDEEHTQKYRELKSRGIPSEDIPHHIAKSLDLGKIVRSAGEVWDGGYAIAGVIGSGDAFVLRDPNGIRPAFYFENDELIAFASERVPLMTVFDQAQEQIQELPPAHVALISSEGKMTVEQFAEPGVPRRCSFERIYFSRGNDPDIYRERQALGAALVPQIINCIGNDFDKTVFTFIPNTAEVGYQGMMAGLRQFRRREVRDELSQKIKDGSIKDEDLDALIIDNWPKGEKIAHKDIKMRTFISQEKGRNQLVSHVYDITYGMVPEGGNLVAIDDSIVRGTTLKQSILKMLSRSGASRIVVVSTAPQIRYPDCYGIDMAELGKFIAFQAAIALLRESGRSALIDQVYQACKAELQKPIGEQANKVKAIYDSFSPEEISSKIAELLSPSKDEWDGEVDVIFQGIGALHEALPEHTGDWYFTGDYPTPGGFAVVNQAFLHFYEEKDGRPYDLGFDLKPALAEDI